ncbi:MAG: carbohydrate-binding protein [Clostridia bacterium]|jgi:hypothetical protein|nr:carbohydrate-binding protein [Clostridia bacterium]
MPRKPAAKSKAGLTEVVEGISITPIPATAGETITIRYDGLLAKSGAQSVYAHLGYGHNDSWDNVEDIVMTNVPQGWTCDILPKGERVNFCFHDGADNWDNNYGYNWSIMIHNG